MADKKSDKKSLSDLGELTSPKPEAPAVAEAPAEAADQGRKFTIESVEANLENDESAR